MIKEDDYFGNYVRLLEKSAQDYFAKLNIPQGPLQYEFNVRATMVNAFYNTQFNTMGKFMLLLMIQWMISKRLL